MWQINSILTFPLLLFSSVGNEAQAFSFSFTTTLVFRLITSNVIIKVTCLSPLSLYLLWFLLQSVTCKIVPGIIYILMCFIVLNCVCCQRKCLGWLDLFITMTHNSMCIVPNMSSVFWCELSYCSEGIFEEAAAVFRKSVLLLTVFFPLVGLHWNWQHRRGNHSLRA